MNQRQVSVLIFAIVVALGSVVGGAGAETPSIDTSTTDGTSTTSEIQSDSVIPNFNGSDNETRIVQVNMSAGNTPELEVTRNGSDTVLVTNDSAVNVSSEAVGGVNYNMSFEESDLAEMTRSINENVTVDVTPYQAANDSNSTTIQIYIENDNTSTVLNVDDTVADDEDEIEVTEDAENGFLDTRVTGFSTLDFSVLDVDERDVDGDNTDVIVVFSNTTVADHAADAVTSDADDGDALYGMTLVVHGDDEGTMPIRVYNEEVPDDVDEDEDTYGVYKEGGIGGEDGVEINLGEHYEDEDSVEVTGKLNAGFGERLSHRAASSDLGLRFGLAISFDYDFGGSDGVVVFAGLAMGAPAARRRPVEEAIEVDEPETPGEDTPAAGSVATAEG